METNRHDRLVTTKGYNKFKPKLDNKQVALTKAIIETDSPGLPQIRIQAHTMHWNITKFVLLLKETPTQIPAIKIKSMLNKELLYSSTLTKVDTPHGTQGTCV